MRLPESGRPWLLGLLVAVLGIGTSAWLAQQQARSAEQVAQARFAQAANALTDAMVRRLDTYTEIAIGLRGLFLTNPALSRREFDHAVQHLEIEDRLPEISNIAFTRYLMAAEKPAFEAQVRADTTLDPRGYPEFAIRPPGERQEYFVAHYLWPMQANLQVHGLDISAQPANLASMRYSRQSGEPVASAPFDLIQYATAPKGFVIRVPVFRSVPDGHKAHTRESDFLGAVAVTLRVLDLLQRLEREGLLLGLRLTLTDRGSSITSMPDRPALALFTNQEPGAASLQRYSRSIQVYGRLWELDFTPGTPFLSDSERRGPQWAGVAGSVIALLLAALVTLLMRQRQAALARVAASREALEDSEGRWKFAIEGSGDALWDWGVADGSMFYSRRWKELLGYADDEIEPGLALWSSRLHPEDLERVLQTLQAHLRGEAPVYECEYRIGCKDGSWKWVLDRGKVVQRGASGAPLRVIGTLSDITGRRRTAQVLQDSLRDKEALLKEVHHRVKNNLQVIMSLLRLEGRRTVRSETRATLADMQGRIASMALLHESLYRSGTFASVDLADYLHKVVQQAYGALTAPGSAVQLRQQLASVEIGMDQALPCGLLVNEMISNALKHGFPNGLGGEVLIALEPVPGTPAWRLRVADNGVGLPAGFTLASQSSMGLQLVSQLCEQIGGTLDVQSTAGKGAEFSVAFQADAPAPLVMPE